MPIAHLTAVAQHEAEWLPAQTVELVNPLVYLNAWAGTPFRHQILTVNAARWFDQPPVALYRYPRGTIVNGEWAEPHVTLCGDQLVRQQLPDWRAQPEPLIPALQARARSAPPVEAPCLLAARYGDVTWGHWVFEMLAKIVLCEAMAPKLFRYLVPARTTLSGGAAGAAYIDAVLQSLAAYGIETHRLLRVPPGGAWRFDALFDLSGLFPVAQEDYFGLHPRLLRLMDEKAQAEPADDLPKRPFILRTKNDARGLMNRAEVADSLARDGFTAIDATGLRFGQQIGLFRQAEAVAAELGSGLTGLLYAPPALPVLTTAPTGWDNHYFVNLLQKRRDYHADIRSDRSGGDAALAPYTVALVDLMQGVRACLGRPTMHQDLGAVTLGDDLLPRRIGAPGFDIRFGTKGNADLYQVAGWAAPEAGHCWSLGAVSTLRLPRDKLPAGDFWLHAIGFSFNLPDKMPVKPLSIAIGATELATFWIEGASCPAWLVRRDLCDDDTWVTVRFHHPVVPTPRSLGVSDDDRALGFGFVRVLITPVESV